MKTQINAYLHFQGNCKEAMDYYQKCLGGELTIQLIRDSPISTQCPAGVQDDVLHGTLVKGDLLLMGSDMGLPFGYVKGNNMALSVSCSSEEEINTFYNKLKEGGEIIDPLKESFWGALFGVVNDKYGIRWMFNYDKNQK